VRLGTYLIASILELRGKDGTQLKLAIEMNLGEILDC